MSRNINSVVIDGHLVKDIELNQNRTVGRFTVAVNESQKGQDGQWSDYANFIDCKIFGKTCENLAPYLTKGKRAAVQGKIHQDRWEKDGQKQSRIVVNVDNICLLSSGQGNEQNGSRNNGNASSSNGNGGFPEDIPF
jgi:single-strand DNA-binding protein